MSSITISPMHVGSVASSPEGLRGLRLTRRGRVVVFLVALVVALCALVAFGPRVIATDEPGTPVPATMVTVEPGQTMWDIAADARPGEDVRRTVHEIAELNALSSPGDLEVGQQIAVPLR